MMIKKKSSTPLWLKISTLALVIVAFLLVYSLFNDKSNDVSMSSTQKFGRFAIYKNEVFVAVPSDGYIELPKADPETIKLLDDEKFGGSQVAVDKDNVYCGNLSLSKLNPAKTFSLGNNYYSDGNLTYYCDGQTESKNLYWFQKVAGVLYSKVFGGEQTTNYWYPFRQLPKSNKPYTAFQLGDYTSTATDGTLVCYKGNVMQDANPKRLRQLQLVYEDGDIRKSLDYFADGKSTYYKGIKLAVDDDPEIYSLTVEGLIDQMYLVCPKKGFVYANEVLFDPKFAPYTLISKFGDHVNQALFTCQSGVFYYEHTSGKVKKAGENPFLNRNFTEIFPNIFLDGKELIYLQDSDIWAKGKSNKSLQSRSTSIMKLDEDLRGNWEKIGEHQFGAVWENSGNYFYFDSLGSTQLVRKTIYKIDNKATAQNILNSNANRNGIEQLRFLIETKKLVSVKAIKLVEAKTKYNMF